ncbi:MAG: hypothetical protein IJQ68_02340 [Methanobrevibacter sp.]|uniref:hypothetical protein n=1 Tax=Methanobrevibacter sp. TaxID=66852 RepID=UPI0025FD24A9|nr:hypothetical protein [Methanobrevibacter sp.]MBR0270819.1 hypothetical protein [Methanobrevibacter sp.]
MDKIKFEQDYTYRHYSSIRTSFVIDVENEECYFDKYEVDIDENSDDLRLDLEKTKKFIKNTENINKKVISQDDIKRIIDFSMEYDKFSMSDHEWNINRNLDYSIRFFENGRVKSIININTKYYDEIIQLNNYLESIIGVPVFDVSFLDYIITDARYDINEKGIFDKSTDMQLKLCKLDFSICYGLFHGCSTSFTIDFINKEFHYKKESIPLDDHTINSILKFIKDYNVYNWYYGDYHEKVQHKRETALDGPRGELKLIFGGKKMLFIVMSGGYPDTYYRLAQKIKEFTGKDYLRKQDMEDVDLYIKYGDKKLDLFKNQNMEKIKRFKCTNCGKIFVGKQKSCPNCKRPLYYYI